MSMTRAQLRHRAACENILITFKRSDLIDVAQTEMVNIEIERLGLKDAA